MPAPPPPSSSVIHDVYSIVSLLMNLILVKLAIIMVMDSFLVVEGLEIHVYLIVEIHCLAVARTGMTATK